MHKDAKKLLSNLLINKKILNIKNSECLSETYASDEYFVNILFVLLFALETIVISSFLILTSWKN